MVLKRLWDAGIVKLFSMLFQGARSPALQLSDLQEGQYTFQLTVTDSSGQQDSDTVSVTVLAGIQTKLFKFLYDHLKDINHFALKQHTVQIYVDSQTTELL